MVSFFVYVDHFIIVENDFTNISNFKPYLIIFHKKESGVLNYFIGIEIAIGIYGFFIINLPRSK